MLELSAWVGKSIFKSNDDHYLTEFKFGTKWFRLFKDPDRIIPKYGCEPAGSHPYSLKSSWREQNLFNRSDIFRDCSDRSYGCFALVLGFDPRPWPLPPSIFSAHTPKSIQFRAQERKSWSRLTDFCAVTWLWCGQFATTLTRASKEMFYCIFPYGYDVLSCNLKIPLAPYTGAYTRSENL